MCYTEYTVSTKFYKFMIASLGVLIVFLLVSIMYLIVSRVATPGPGLCQYESPRPITTTVAGVPGPSVHEGRAVVMQAQRCVEGVPILNVDAYRSFQALDDNDNIVSTKPQIANLVSVPQARALGKTINDESVQLPPEVTVGRWRLTGADIAIKTGDIRTWFSQPFWVVP